jgi:hypothetical protein
MAVGISTDFGPRVRISTRVCVVASFIVTMSTRAAAAADGKTLIDDLWARYRTVRSERQESEILVIKAPPTAPYLRADAERLLRDAPAGVARKRAVHHVRYADDGHDELHVLFSLPAEDAGLGLLVARDPAGMQDDLWLYMPGYHRVRRIPASSDQKFAGTDLIYEDVRAFLGEHTDAFTYSEPATEPLDGRPADLVMATPKDGTATAYRRRKIWIDREWRLPVRVEFFDAQARLWKTLRNGAITEVAPGVHRADLTEMRDVQRNSATLVLVTKRTVGADIPAQVFTQDYLLHPGAD